MKNGFHSEYYGNDPTLRPTRYCTGCRNEYYEDNLTRIGYQWSCEWLCDNCLAEVNEREFAWDYEDCLAY